MIIGLVSYGWESSWNIHGFSTVIIYTVTKSRDVRVLVKLNRAKVIIVFCNFLLGTSQKILRKSVTVFNTSYFNWGRASEWVHYIVERVKYTRTNDVAALLQSRPLSSNPVNTVAGTTVRAVFGWVEPRYFSSHRVNMCEISAV